MKVRVVKSGVMDTLQDRGRYGFSHWGINVSGSMDRFAAGVANAMLGNAISAPVIEMHYPCGEYFFEEATAVAVTGADFGALANGTPIPPWKVAALPAGTLLSFQRNRRGSRAYLAIQGNWLVAPWLGSTSTNLKAGAGGYQGRPLKTGDVLAAGASRIAMQLREPFVFPWSVSTGVVYEPAPFAFIPGGELDWLSDPSRLESVQFRVSPSSDRMAIRLVHDPLKFRKEHELLSTGVSFGTLQLLPDGHLVVLMADHQTTGGYPRIGHVITADLPRLAQLAARDTLTFRPTTVEEAEKKLLSLHADLRRIQHACRAQLKVYENH